MTVKKEKKPDVLYAVKVEYIDPLYADSKVGYKIIGTSYGFEADLSLSDCNRFINWSFCNLESNLSKIDGAITMLTNFRADLVKAQKQYKKDFPPDPKDNE